MLLTGLAGLTGTALLAFLTSSNLMISRSTTLGLDVDTLHLELFCFRLIHTPSSANATCFVSCTALGPLRNARYGSYTVGMRSRRVLGGGCRAWNPWLIPSAETVGSNARLSLA